MARARFLSLGTKATTTTGACDAVDVSDLDDVVCVIYTTSNSFSVTFEISMDGTSFVAGPTVVGSSTLTASGKYQCPPKVKQVRMNVTAHSNSATIYGFCSGTDYNERGV